MTDTNLVSDKTSGSTPDHDSFIDISELSVEETKHFLTPFAFSIDKSLFGLPLASPSKRAIALLIDLILIAILSGIPGVVLALAIAITLYRLGNKQRVKQVSGKTKGAKRRAIMRFISALILFFILLDTLPKLLVSSGIDDESSPINIESNIEGKLEGSPLSLKSSIALTGFVVSTMSTIEESDCMQLECWKNTLEAVATDMAKIKANDTLDIKPSQATSILTEIGEKTKLGSIEQAELTQFMLTTYQLELTKLGHEIIFEDAEQRLVEEVDVPQTSNKQDKPSYSIIELVKGVISDLGLGFGWAAFYFTVFTALNCGQTIGKKITGIKVLQLDGTPLSFWDSFGRYGGYGAGIATGLLGFIQIYWDPNRQAIHDKISATVVIDVKKARFSQQLSKSELSN